MSRLNAILAAAGLALLYFGIGLLGLLIIGLPAHAKETARYDGPDGAVVLDDSVGKCQSGWLSAMWVDKRAGAHDVPGCWHAHTTDDGTAYILVAFDDGDRIAYFKRDFKDTP